MAVAGFGLGFGRFGFTDLPSAVTVFVAALLLAVLALLLAAISGVAIWNRGVKGLGRALTGAVLALALLGWPMVILVALSTVVRWSCVAVLGKHWNPRLIVIPGASLVRRGPYRWLQIRRACATTAADGRYCM